MSNENRLEHVLEVLGVLSRLTENKRLFLKNKNLYIENYRTLKMITRWFYKERERCFEYIKTIMNEAIDMSQNALEKWSLSKSYIDQQKYLRQYGRLTQSLEIAIRGIKTQLVTYKNDELFCSRIDVFANKIQDKLSDMDLKMQMTPLDSGAVEDLPMMMVEQTNVAPQLQKPMTTEQIPSDSENFDLDL